jgi:hypothetical protein
MPSTKSAVSALKLIVEPFGTDTYTVTVRHSNGHDASSFGKTREEAIAFCQGVLSTAAALGTQVEIETCLGAA